MRSKIGLRSVFCAVLIFAYTAPLQALMLPADNEGSVSLVGAVEYLVTQDDLSAQQAWRQAPDFRPIATRYIDVGRTRETVWLRTELTNPEQTPRVARLDIGRQYIEWLRIYLIRQEAANKPELLYEAQSDDSFSARPIDDLLLLADINFEPGETVGLLLAFRSVDTTWMPLRIGSVEALDAEHRTTVTVDWLLNGALLAMVVFALLMGPVIGWRLAVSFAVYILVATAYVAHADGYTFRYLWPDLPGWHDAVRLFLILLMPVAALNFAQRLFDFSKFGSLTGAMRVLMLAATCGAVGARWVVQIPWLMTMTYLLVPICSVVQVLAGVSALRSQQLGAWPYLAGALFVCSSFIYAAVAHLQPGAWDVDFTLDYGHLALVGETLSFAIAIALRLRGLRRDVSDAQSLAAQTKEQLDALNHDIRQPLVALRQGIAKLESGDLREQMIAASNYLESLAKHGPVLEKPDEPESFSASMLLDGVREMFEDEAADRGVELYVPDSEIVLQADPIALMRIVTNLVANALEHGGDQITVELSATQPLVISVRDNGVGMDTETLKKRLQRGDTGTGFDGRGLGLDIVQTMAEAIGAGFTLESSLGKGTHARVELPAERA